MRETVTVSFGGEGLPLGQLPDAMRALAAKAPAAKAPVELAPPAKIGRNAPCPCGSGTKFKKCCGSARSAGGRDLTSIVAVACARPIDAFPAEGDRQLGPERPGEALPQRGCLRRAPCLVAGDAAPG